MSIPALGGNYIDLIIIFVVFLYVTEGLERGFWNLAGDLISFLGSIAIALRAYPFISRLLIANFDLPDSFAKALGFVLAAIIASQILGLGVGKILSFAPEVWRKTWWSRAASILPAVVDSSILIAAFLTLFVSLPVSPGIKADILDSKIGGFYVSRATGFEKTLTEIFGGAFNDTLTFLTVKPGTREKIDIHYKPRTLTVDETSEAKMLTLVNIERAKVGVRPLVVDPKITAVARAHSRDMWVRGYFSHIDPDGKSPFDRMEAGGVSFQKAGENIALAPTLDLAHQGLMNSEGHRRNILDPDFGRVGIGIIDGGVYGKMFTQNFAD